MLAVPAALRRTTTATAPAAARAASTKARLPTVATCPAATCACAAMPEGLKIDRASPLEGVMAPYAEQVLVCTGQDDWASRIEDERGGDNLAADLKELLGRGGVYRDPLHPVSVLNASFPSSAAPRADAQNTSAYLLPSFLYVLLLPRVSFASAEALVRGFLLAATPHAAHGALSPLHRDRLTRSDAHRRLLPAVRPVRDVLVLVCGHGGRDTRCGVAVHADGGDDRGRGDESDDGQGKLARGTARAAATTTTTTTTARVALVSHVGGHKFAGNAIIYLPPGIRRPDGEPHPLAGHGIWYGRMEPRHVEGLVRETVLGGRVVADLFRGGIDMQRRTLRL